jgi:hypothetical protein
MQSATLFVRMQEHEKIIERKEAISKKRRISLYSLWALPGQIYS